MNGGGFMESKRTYSSFELNPVRLDSQDECLSGEFSQGKSFTETIYAEEKIPFSSNVRRGFLPGVPVHVSIVDAELSGTSSRLNPYIYTIELKHGPFRWTVKRRYHHFFKVYTSVVLAKKRQTLAHPLKSHRETISTDQSLDSNRPGSMPNSPRLNLDNRVQSLGGKDETDGYAQQQSEDEDDFGKCKFPKKPDVLVSSEAPNVEERRKQLEAYLQELLRSEERHNKDLLDFLEVSEYSFLRGSVKRKEGIVKKRTGDDQSHGWISQLMRNLKYLICSTCGIRWKKSWILVEETCIIGVSPKTGEIRAVLLFDQDFACSSGIRQTGVKNSILISNFSRALWLKTFTPRKTKDWVEAIERAAAGDPARSFIQPNRFGSFAPVRTSEVGQWFVDGERYMSAVADAIEQAQEEIFITDWWLSPEIHLKRGVNFSEELRLDKLLKKKSAEGVRIFILLYKEFQLALSLNSFYTKRTLMTRGGKNIKVLRHPDRVGADMNDFLWAHHEKIVVIDQTIAFVGGIDLCYGRWDTNAHPLTDIDVVDKSGVGSASGAFGSNPILHMAPSNSSRAKPRLAGPGMHLAFVLRTAHEVTTLPIRAMYTPERPEGEDSMDAGVTSGDDQQQQQHGMKSRLRNAMKKAKTKLRTKKDRGRDSPETSSPESTEVSDSDSEIDSSFDTDDVNGEANHDDSLKRRRSRMARRRNTVKRSIQKAIKKIKRRRSSTDSVHSLKADGIVNGHDTDDSLNADDGPMSLEEDKPDSSIQVAPPSSNLWRGKDYVNFIVKDIARPDLPEADNVDRRTTPRMPWHDISVMVAGATARDVARHFIQRWNLIKSRKAKFNPKYPFLVPKSYSTVDEDKTERIKSYLSATRSQSYNVKCQVLRSSSIWSAGIDTVESSIHSAMVSAIRDAQHYVYIENQFFITSVNASRSDSEVQNQIGNALFQRVLQAHKENQAFKVYIMLPLLPAFEGQIGSATTGNALRVILHYMYASICRGDNSLFKQLEREGINPFKYISICSLRTWAELLGTPVTELVYIHSKLMIVDDRVVICGSANINDRSLLGTRDSEVCLILEDTEFSSCLFNGQKAESGRFAGSLRRKLMREHLGIQDGDRTAHDLVADPVSDAFWKDVWLRRASLNTKVFEEAFLIYPNDRVRSLDECKKFEEQTPLAEIDRFGTLQLLRKVKGNLVLLPLCFLENEHLLPSYFAKEGMVPSVTWT